MAIPTNNMAPTNAISPHVCCVEGGLHPELATRGGEGLRPYVQHWTDCEYDEAIGGVDRCTCGLVLALAASPPTEPSDDGLDVERRLTSWEANVADHERAIGSFTTYLGQPIEPQPSLLLRLVGRRRACGRCGAPPEEYHADCWHVVFDRIRDFLGVSG